LLVWIDRTGNQSLIAGKKRVRLPRVKQLIWGLEEAPKKGVAHLGVPHPFWGFYTVFTPEFFRLSHTFKMHIINMISILISPFYASFLCKLLKSSIFLVLVHSACDVQAYDPLSGN